MHGPDFVIIAIAAATLCLLFGCAVCGVVSDSTRGKLPPRPVWMNRSVKKQQPVNRAESVLCRAGPQGSGLLFGVRIRRKRGTHVTGSNSKRRTYRNLETECRQIKIQ